MITCRDIYNLNLDGVTLLTGEAGMDKMVSWIYIVQGRPNETQMNRGDFALLQVDYVHFDMQAAFETMLELNELGISGIAVSVVDDRESIPISMIEHSVKLNMPLFYVSWNGASFSVITHSIGMLLLEAGVKNKREGDFLYNLLFGHDINQKYIDKISNQFSLDFSKPYRVGVVIVNRKYGMNLEQDEQTYDFYANSLNREIQEMKSTPLFMKFLNKFVLLFESKQNHEVEHEIETILKALDDRPQFRGKIQSICILGTAYSDPRKFGASYTEAKSLIPQLDYLPNPKNKKVLSASTMGIVYVDPVAYYNMPYADKGRIANVIGKINWAYKGKNKHMLLIVPGRIGTSSPELGVPTTFSDISEFEAICEVEERKAGYNPELSYGSHIFQDLVEAEILYTAVFSNEKTIRYTPEKLKEYPNLIKEYTEEAMIGDIVSLFDMSGTGCELYNDLEQEKLILRV